MLILGEVDASHKGFVVSIITLSILLCDIIWLTRLGRSLYLNNTMYISLYDVNILGLWYQ